jgi:3-oxoacyl-[acyl-carrier-protein] synthase II
MIIPRVAVTGLGLCTGLGLDRATSWDGLVSGRFPVKRYTLFDPTGLSAPFGVELPPQAQQLFEAEIKPRSRSQMTRGTMIGMVCARMAVEESAIMQAGIAPARIGIVIGSTGTGYNHSGQHADPNRILKNMANAPAAWLSLKYKIEGPAFTVSTACASGAYALHTAMQLILTGQCDAVISGATDSAINFQDIEGFCNLMALSDDIATMATSSRPFDRQRNGFVMGEGAGMLVVESIEHARKRKAHIHALTTLPGLCSEAYNIISPCPDGSGMARAMRLALDNAGLMPEAIDYINAHGTSTQHNDRCETEAIKAVFGEKARQIPVSSTKSMTGHCLCAAAGVEAVIAVQALVAGIIPPTLNLHDPDPACDLDYVPNQARPATLKQVMSNSFAFGGHNAVCIFSAPDTE